METSNAQRTIYGFEMREPDERRKEDRKTPNIKSMWSRHKEIVELDSLGYKGTEIAELLGIHPLTVSNTLNSDLGVKAVVRTREERESHYDKLRDKVLDLTEKSLAIYEEILTESDDSSRVSLDMKRKTADTIMLELSGMRAAQTINTKSVHTVATLEEIEGFKQRGMAAAKSSGSLEEAKDVTPQTTE